METGGKASVTDSSYARLSQVFNHARVSEFVAIANIVPFPSTDEPAYYVFYALTPFVV